MSRLTMLVPTLDPFRPTLQRSIHAALAAAEPVHVLIVADRPLDPAQQAAFAAAFADRPAIRLIVHAVNLGVSTARNTGLHAVLTEFTMFLDDDDLVSTALLDHLLAVLRDEAPDFVFHKVLISDGAASRPANQRLPASCREVLMFNRIGTPSGVCVRTGIATRVLFDPRMTQLEDLDFYVRYLGETGLARLRFVEEFSILYAETPHSMTTTGAWPLRLAAALQLAAKHGSSLGEPAARYGAVHMLLVSTSRQGLSLARCFYAVMTWLLLPTPRSLPLLAIAINPRFFAGLRRSLGR